MPQYQSYYNKKKKQGGEYIPPASPRIQHRDYQSLSSSRAQRPPPLEPLKRPRIKSPPAGRQPPAQNPAIRKRSNYIIHFTAAAVMVMIALAAFFGAVLFNVNDVVVKGESIYTSEQILAAANINSGVNLLRLDTERVQQDITQSLFLLDKVVVEKVWGLSPAISITVENAQRMLSISNGGGYLEISKNGRIINKAAGRPDGLLITGFTPTLTDIGDFLDCEFDEAKKTDLVFELVGLIEKHELHQINRIDVSDRFDVRLFNGAEEHVEVKLGGQSQLVEKFAVAANIISEQIAGNERGVLTVSSTRKAFFNPDLYAEENLENPPDSDEEN
jgi:cell division protein FtsQ